jgi:hypothetical protein
LITAAKPKEYIMKFDSGFADAVGQVDRVVNKPSIPKMARLSPQLKQRLVASAAAALLAFAVGLLVAVFGAWAADEPARPRPTAERAGTDAVRAQPTAKQFAPPNQPDVSDRDSIYVDELYRQLIGPPSATSPGSRSITRRQPAPKR